MTGPAPGDQPRLCADERCKERCEERESLLTKALGTIASVRQAANPWNGIVSVVLPIDQSKRGVVLLAAPFLMMPKVKVLSASFGYQ